MTISGALSPEAQRSTDDLSLLQRFEPVLRFNQGEDYTPQSVDPYIARCSLHVHHPDGREELLVPRGSLTPELLMQPRLLKRGSVVYLGFADPLDLPELTAMFVSDGIGRLRGPNAFRPRIGRLARLGYVSRLLAAIFSVTLLLRGRVPGDAAAAARLETDRMRRDHGEQVYYGRVIRDPRGWTVLQYWYFYSFDNWRSGFYGANDHEADWEMASVYLYQRADGEYVPCWVAYSCHDFAGGDLRRRWDDDEELERLGEHPVLYVGAGSHAGYFRPGDYLAEIDIPLFTPLARVLDLVRQFWVGTLHQSGRASQSSRLSLFRIPFVDYARGDGTGIGEGEARRWTPVLLDPVPGWAHGFRGLWGYYARDPLSGENSPAGPLFDRDGSPRRSWEDPLGWAGLDGTVTPDAEPGLLEQRRLHLRARQEEIHAELDAELANLELARSDLIALEGQPHGEEFRGKVNQRQMALRRKIADLRQEAGECTVLIEAIQHRQAQQLEEIPDPPRAHISNLATPVPEPDYRLQRLVDLWSALSVAVLVGGILALMYTDAGLLPPHLLLLVMGILLVDAIVRGQLQALAAGMAVVLAVVCGVILVYVWFIQLLVGGAIAAVLYLTWTNVREIRR